MRIVAPDPRPHARRRLPHPEQEGHAAAACAHRRVDGSADPPLQDLHRGLQGARGRGLRGDREPARRDRLLHRQRRLGDAVPHARPRSVVRQHPVPAAHDARRAGRRRGGRSSPASTPCSARWIADGRLNDANVRLAHEIIGRYPRPGRPPSRCCTSRSSRTATSPTTRSSTSASWSAPRRPRCSARARSTRCSSSSRSAST